MSLSSAAKCGHITNISITIIIYELGCKPYATFVCSLHTIEALKDLNRALELATERQARTKCHAHCQRGVLYRKLENLDAARADFEAAAQLGSKFAREQVSA